MDECVSGLVSVVIPTFNRKELLRAAVRSVLEQTYERNEIIIVDDGSTDGSKEAIAELSSQHGERVRSVFQQNRGPGPARESGRLQARGEFIQYLDSDDLLHLRKFERQVALLRARPDADIAYGVTRLVDASGRVLDPSYRWSGEQRDFLFPGLLVDRWWSTTTPLWRRTLCERVGPWSDLRYSEDWDYEARAGALGARLASVNEVVSDTRRHDGSRETNAGRWLEPADQVRFFTSIHDGACRAGVPLNGPEIRHFSRWTFAASRAAAAQGDDASAQALLAIARRCAEGHALDMAAYGLAGRVLGFSRAARLLAAAHRLRGRRKGPDTQRQSWMDKERPRG